MKYGIVFQLCLFWGIFSGANAQIVATGTAHPLSDVSQYSVEDFEIHANQIIRLEFYGTFKSYVLSLLTMEGKVQSTLVLQKIRQVEKLHRSCDGIIYLLTASRAYPLRVTEDTLALEDFLPIANFNRFIKPCQIAEGEQVYYLFEAANGLKKIVQKYQVETESLETLRVISNEQQVDTYESDIATITEGQNSGEFSSKKAHCSQEIGRLQAEGDFLSNVFYKLEDPVCLYPCHQGLAIFNHPQRSIEIYAQEQLKYTLPISYPSNKNWLKEISHDPQSHQFYTFFKQEDGILVQHISLATGQLKTITTISADALQLKKIKIFNGSLFLLKENPKQGHRKELLRRTL